MIKTSLIIGCGNIGKAVAEFDKNGSIEVTVLDIDHCDHFEKAYDVIHICYPCGDPNAFIKTTQEYLETYKAPLIFIHSTVPPFLLESLFISPDSTILHCPIRGTHPNIIEGIKKYPLIIGSVYSIDLAELECIRLSYFTKIWDVEVIFVKNSNESALGKLMNTAWYSMQIAFANQIQRICDDYNLDFKNVYIQWMKTDEINSEYQYSPDKDRAIAVGKQIPRPIMVAGELGGYCLMPNIKLASELFSDNFTKWIEEMNDYGKSLGCYDKLIYSSEIQPIISDLKDIFQNPHTIDEWKQISKKMEIEEMNDYGKNMNSESKPVGELRQMIGLSKMVDVFKKIPNSEQICKDMYGLTPEELDNMKFQSMQRDLMENEEK